MNRFQITTTLKLHSNRSDRRATLGSVSYGSVEDGKYITYMNTPNEKFMAAIKSLCDVMGIAEVEYKSRWVHNNYTCYYRVRGTDVNAPYYTAGDFTVVLSSMLSKRLADGEKLAK